jgi:hypothetical protein
MKYLLKLEELFLFGLALFLFSGLDYGWGAAQYTLWFFAPDLSMLGYLVNPRVGAWTYNLIHHKGLSATLYVLGYLLSIPWLMFVARADSMNISRIRERCLNLLQNGAERNMLSLIRWSRDFKMIKSYAP